MRQRDWWGPGTQQRKAKHSDTPLSRNASCQGPFRLKNKSLVDLGPWVQGITETVAYKVD